MFQVQRIKVKKLAKTYLNCIIGNENRAVK